MNDAGREEHTVLDLACQIRARCRTTTGVDTTALNVGGTAYIYVAWFAASLSRRVVHQYAVKRGQYKYRLHRIFALGLVGDRHA